MNRIFRWIIYNAFNLGWFILYLILIVKIVLYFVKGS